MMREAKQADFAEGGDISVGPSSLRDPDARSESRETTDNLLSNWVRSMKP